MRIKRDSLYVSGCYLLSMPGVARQKSAAGECGLHFEWRCHGGVLSHTARASPALRKSAPRTGLRRKRIDDSGSFICGSGMSCFKSPSSRCPTWIPCSSEMTSISPMLLMTRLLGERHTTGQLRIGMGYFEQMLGGRIGRQSSRVELASQRAVVIVLRMGEGRVPIGLGARVSFSGNARGIGVIGSRNSGSGLKC